MAIRKHDASIWDEDWFVEMNEDFKLLYLFIEAKADQSGIWRPNFRQFQRNIINNKQLHIESFYQEVNKYGSVILKLPNGNWFLVNTITRELGKLFNPKIGAHRGALKRLVDNGIHPSQINGMIWSGIEKLDIEDIRKMVHGRAMHTRSMEETLSMHGQRSMPNDQRSMINDQSTMINDQQVDENEKNGGEGSSQDPFTDQIPPSSSGSPTDIPKNLQSLYDKSYEEVKSVGGSMSTISEQDWKNWKEFFDKLVECNAYSMFQVRTFLNVGDLRTLIEEKGFSKDIWKSVIEKMCGTGIKKEWNLYFKIADYVKYVNEKKHTTTYSSKVSFGGNKTNITAPVQNFNKQEKW